MISHVCRAFVKPVVIPENTLIVALDLGTTTGWSTISSFSGFHWVGSVRLAGPKEVMREVRATNDVRFARLRDYTLAKLQTDQTQTARVAVAWEDVQFCSSAYQFQLWNVLRCAVWAAIDQFEVYTSKVVSRYAVPVGTLKKFATGSGAADKARMAECAKPIIGACADNLDDNAIDAYWLSRWVAQQRF